MFILILGKGNIFLIVGMNLIGIVLMEVNMEGF